MPSERVASLIERVRHGLDLGEGTEFALAERAAEPHAENLAVDQIQHRRDNDNAVEIVGKALGLDQPLRPPVEQPSQ